MPGLRLGSSAGPIILGFVMSSMGIQYVFATFAIILLIGAVITALFAIETKGRVLEELSP
ncbi:dipeptide/tripeptide permease [Rhizobium leguminosarum]